MLPKYYRFRVLWDGDQTLTYDDGARLSLRLSPWKLVSGVLTYGTTIIDDFGFGAGDTLVDDGEIEGSVNDNTSNLYWGINGYFEVTADLSSTDGTVYLYMESSDDNSNWPSDQDDFDIDDMDIIVALPLSTDDVDESRGTNFEIRV